MISSLRCTVDEMRQVAFDDTRHTSWMASRVNCIWKEIQDACHWRQREEEKVSWERRKKAETKESDEMQWERKREKVTLMSFALFVPFVSTYCFTCSHTDESRTHWPRRRRALRIQPIVDIVVATAACTLWFCVLHGSGLFSQSRHRKLILFTDWNIKTTVDW